MPSKCEEAKGLLTHYLQMIALRTGLRWSPDYQAEAASIVDLIVAAAVEASATAAAPDDVRAEQEDAVIRDVLAIVNRIAGNTDAGRMIDRQIREYFAYEGP